MLLPLEECPEVNLIWGALKHGSGVWVAASFREYHRNRNNSRELRAAGEFPQQWQRALV